MTYSELTTDPDGRWYLGTVICSNEECKKILIRLGVSEHLPDTTPFPDISVVNYSGRYYKKDLHTWYVWPRQFTRPIPPEVPKELADEFNEAAAVLPISPKASAALSRRCLQNLIQNHLGVTGKRNLSEEIQAVIDSGQLTSGLEKEIDAIRTIGNFAAHPSKDKNTGLIVEVEEGEAEWNLDVLEDLFDHFFVKEVKRRQRIQDANKKLKAAGKPPLKGGGSQPPVVP